MTSLCVSLRHQNESFTVSLGFYTCCYTALLFVKCAHNAFSFHPSRSKLMSVLWSLKFSSDGVWLPTFLSLIMKSGHGQIVALWSLDLLYVSLGYIVCSGGPVGSFYDCTNIWRRHLMGLSTVQIRIVVTTWRNFTFGLQPTSWQTLIWGVTKADWLIDWLIEKEE